MSVASSIRFTQAAGFSAHVSGWLRGNSCFVQRSVRDLNDDTTRVFVDNMRLEGDSLLRCPFSVESLKFVALDVSPSLEKTLILRTSQKDEKPIIELQDTRRGNLKIDASDVHSKVLGDSFFGGISWSSDERYVAYTAMLTPPHKKSSYLDLFTEGPAAIGSPARGDKSEFVEDWGEKYEGVSSTCLCVLDTHTGRVTKVPGIDSSLQTVGQPVFQPSTDGTTYSLVYTSWSNVPRRLGMIFCYQRPCSVFSCDITALLQRSSIPDESGSTLTHIPLSTGLALARSPRFSPDGKLIFIGRREPLASHNGCFSLFLKEKGMKLDELRVVTDIVAAPHIVAEEGERGTATNGISFPGIFCDQLPRQPFINEGSGSLGSVLLTSTWGCRESVIKVDLESGEVQRLSPLLTKILEQEESGSGSSSSSPAMWNQNKDASCAVLDVDIVNGRVLFQASSPLLPQRLGVFDLRTQMLSSAAPPLPSTIAYRCLDPKVENSKAAVGEAQVAEAAATAAATSAAKMQLGELSSSFLSNCSWKIKQHKCASGGVFESILVLPAREEAIDAPIPLLLSIHGGPHSVMPTSYIASYAFLLADLGCAILHVNYRGSTGYGQESIDSLLGNIGSNDVADLMQALQETLDDHPTKLDKSQLLVAGGSHGGFLTGHLIGQFPDTFKAAAMRNPVTNIPSMLGVTDIPDWCFIECLGAQGYDFTSVPIASDEILAKMRRQSPVAHVDAVKTPTILCLGGKDRRVPPSQGIEFYHLLKARGVDTKLLMFPDDTHAIDKPTSEFEHFVAISAFFKKALSMN